MNTKSIILFVFLIVFFVIAYNTWQKVEQKKHEEDLPNRWKKLTLDLNNDGKENKDDLKIVKELLTQCEDPASEQFRKADVVQDGCIKENDIYYFEEGLKREPRF